MLTDPQNPKKTPGVVPPAAPDFIPADGPDFIPAEPVASHEPVNTEGYDWNPKPEKTLWQKLNTGVVSPDALQQSWFGAGMSQDELAKKRDTRYLNESPAHTYVRTLVEGVGHDLADVGSGMTSPVSAATAAAGKVVQTGKAIPKILKKLAKPVMGAVGLGSMVQGASDVSEGAPLGDVDRALYYGLYLTPDSEAPQSSPEKIQQTLMGGAQFSGGAAPVYAAGKNTVKRIGSRVAPEAFVTGEDAWIKALKPQNVRDIPNLRRAYRELQAELRSSRPGTIEELRDFAANQRRAVIQQLDANLIAHGQNVNVDPVAVYHTMQDSVTSQMQLERTYEPYSMKTNPGPREQAIQASARTIGENLARRPISLVEAAKVVHDINAMQKSFYRMTPDMQWQTLNSNPETMSLFALKDALQTQLDAHVQSYSDLNRKYGAWKEAERAADKRLDTMAKTQPDTQLARRTFEASLAAVGGGLGLGGHELAGGFFGYKMGQAAGNILTEELSQPDRILNRSYAPTTYASASAMPAAVASGERMAVSHDQQPKIATRKMITDYAIAKRVDPAVVEAELKKAGYRITTVPTKLAPLTKR